MIKSNKGTNSLSPLKNIINLENLNDIVYDENDKCELLNRYFCKISKLDEENKNIPFFENRTESILSNIIITEKELTDIIEVLDLKKATGPDKISHRML